MSYPPPGQYGPPPGQYGYPQPQPVYVQQAPPEKEDEGCCCKMIKCLLCFWLCTEICDFCC
ncbi:uncharacterized protein ASCRUDRAFT_81641 [Ascoidea rubescens DSM 1968]|uniref:Cysteine-rich transmembrane CYSTM domain-containing protein n=1 Tax=Ascoidea rubescens DSM 1968 TaxID=1344418 RepID=A0A1D2VF56_9ASCO|nr:hypothetical protein ASCRUDRAFT_81641 [Ascoidea rubescens DSM 1968]ODV60212.1 hypothetical protein ASCRUDRAFT_81641 [Ascoidea rubescens DSM 1968]